MAITYLGGGIIEGTATGPNTNKLSNGDFDSNSTTGWKIINQNQRIADSPNKANPASSNALGYITYKKITGATSGEIIKKVGFQLNSCTNASFKVGIFSDSGNQPDELLTDGSGNRAVGEVTGVTRAVHNPYGSSSNSNNSSRYYEEVPLTYPVAVPSSGNFWVAVLPNASDNNYFLMEVRGSASATYSVYATSSTPSGQSSNYSNLLNNDSYTDDAPISGNGTNDVNFWACIEMATANQKVSVAGNAGDGVANALNFHFNANKSNCGASYDLQQDLGSGVNASDTKWRLEWDFNVTDWYYTGDSYTSQLGIGLSDTDADSFAGTQRRHIMMNMYYRPTTSSGQAKIKITHDEGSDYMSWSDSGYPHQNRVEASTTGSQNHSWFPNPSTSHNTNFSFHFVLTRDSSTSFTLKVYDNADYDTLHATLTGTCSATTTKDLRYLLLQIYGDPWTYLPHDPFVNIDNIKFYNGTVDSGGTVPDDDKEKITNILGGTRYHETDTRKVFRYDDTGYGSVATGTDGNFDTASNVSVNSSVSTPSGLGDDTIVANNTKLAWSASGTTVIPHHADFTMAYWLYPTDVNAGSSSTNQSWIQPSSGYAPIRVEQMWSGGANKVSFWVTDDDGDNAGGDYTFTPAEDTWHLFIGDFDASTGKSTYYCGKVGTDSTPQELGNNTDSGCKGASSSTELRTIAGNDSEYFKGRWGEFCVWNKVLSSSERSSLYNSGNGAKANTVAKTNITAYFDGSSATGVNLALQSGWKEKGVA